MDIGVMKFLGSKISNFCQGEFEVYHEASLNPKAF